MTNQVEDTEAGWAYRYGQEARIRQEIETRYVACIYDIGVVIEQFKEVLRGVSNDDDSWLERLPAYVDQLHDLGCLVQQFLVDPVGEAKDSELSEAIDAAHKQIKGGDSSDENPGLDALVEKYLSARNKANIAKFNEWLKKEPPLFMGYKKRKEINRRECVGEFLTLFMKLLKKKGLSDEMAARMIRGETLQ